MIIIVQERLTRTKINLVLHKKEWLMWPAEYPKFVAGLILREV